MDRTITPQDYQDMKGRVDKEIVLYKEKLTELQQEISPFKVYIQKEVPMLENLLEYHRKSDGVTSRIERNGESSFAGASEDEVGEGESDSW